MTVEKHGNSSDRDPRDGGGEPVSKRGCLSTGLGTAARRRRNRRVGWIAYGHGSPRHRKRARNVGPRFAPSVDSAADPGSLAWLRRRDGRRRREAGFNRI